MKNYYLKINKIIIKFIIIYFLPCELNLKCKIWNQKISTENTKKLS